MSIDKYLKDLSEEVSGISGEFGPINACSLQIGISIRDYFDAKYPKEKKKYLREIALHIIIIKYMKRLQQYRERQITILKKNRSNDKQTNNILKLIESTQTYFEKIIEFFSLGNDNIQFADTHLNEIKKIIKTADSIIKAIDELLKLDHQFNNNILKDKEQKFIDELETIESSMNQLI